MDQSSSLRFLLAVLFAVAFLATACGSDAEPVATSSDAPDPVPAVNDEEPADDPIPVETNDGIGDTPFGGIPFFGANDDQCASTVLTNSDDDQANVQAGAECFLAEVEAGTPVVWDLNQATVEGDPIFIRHLFDGDAIWFLRDDRADEYGSGTVTSERCEAAELSSWGVSGVACETADYPSFAGFPEAE